MRFSLEAPDVPLIRFVYCDNAGVLRGKSIPTATLEARLHMGIGCTVAMQAVTVMDELVAMPLLGVIGEFRLIPAVQTLTRVPHAEAAILLCDLFDLDQRPWGACPRDFLKRMKARLHAHGLHARIGTEHEFHLVRLASGRAVPADEAPLFGTEALDLHAPFLTESLVALTEAGIHPTVLHAEYGPGQMEISLAPVEALAAADQVCLFRELMRAIALHHGMRVSFAPKPFVEQMAGNGEHLHISLWDEQEQPALADAPMVHLSSQGRWFLGGVLAHLPGLVALTCASANSYQRLAPQSWSSAYGCWGLDNREAALRLPSLYWGHEQQSLNIELRCADHSGNPYLALGGLLAAGIDGLERQLDPGVPLSCDPASLSDDERERRGIRRLPHTLGEALEALEADALLIEALGPLLADSYLRVKRAEAACFAEQTPAEIAQAHLFKY